MSSPILFSIENLFCIWGIEIFASIPDKFKSEGNPESDLYMTLSINIIEFVGLSRNISTGYPPFPFATKANVCPASFVIVKGTCQLIPSYDDFLISGGSTLTISDPLTATTPSILAS